MGTLIVVGFYLYLLIGVFVMSNIIFSRMYQYIPKKVSKFGYVLFGIAVLVFLPATLIVVAMIVVGKLTKYIYGRFFKNGWNKFVSCLKSKIYE